MSAHSFSKSERLCSKILVQNLFAKGNCAVSQFPFRIIWQPVNQPTWEFPAQVLVSVSKKNFKKSTDRNQIKRLLRELYRLNKPSLYSTLTEMNMQVTLAIIYQSNSILRYQQLQPLFVNCLAKCLNQIKANGVAKKSV